MGLAIDIFARLPDGSPIWLEAVEGLEAAHARVKELNRVAHNHYFIYSELTGTFEREDQTED